MVEHGSMWCCSHNGRKVEQGSQILFSLSVSSSPRRFNVISNITEVSGYQTLCVGDQTAFHDT